MQGEGRPDDSLGSGTSRTGFRAGRTRLRATLALARCGGLLPVAQPGDERRVGVDAVEQLRSHAGGESSRLNRHARRLYAAWLLFAWVGGLSAVAAAATTALLLNPANRWAGAALALLASVSAFATSMLPARKAAQAFEWAWGWHELDDDLTNFKGYFKGWSDAAAWDEYQSFRDRARELYQREHAAMAQQDRARQALRHAEHRGR